MEWLRENSVFLLFFILMMTMHLFGHGMHGGHGGHGASGEDEEHKGHSGIGNKKQKEGHGCC